MIVNSDFIKSFLKIPYTTNVTQMIRYYNEHKSDSLDKKCKITEILDFQIYNQKIFQVVKLQIFALVKFLGFDYSEPRDSFFYVNIKDFQKEHF